MGTIILVGDIGLGHPGCDTPTPTITGSTKTLCNGSFIHRKGDLLDKHCKHPRVTIGGSTTVMVEGKGVARGGDAISCGGVLVGSTINVEIGD